MKLRQPWLIKLVAFIASQAIWLWMRTVRYTFEMHPRVHPYQRSCDEHFIYAVWHDSLLSAVGRRWPGRFFALISRSADGELITRIAHFLGFETLRGSTSRGAAMAVRAMLNAGARGDLFVTPDGPRGPRHKLQTGIVYVAAKTGMPIVPVVFRYGMVWRARSWDRFAIPWPGSRVCMVAGAPIEVPPELDEDAMEEYRARVEAAFARLAEKETRAA